MPHDLDPSERSGDGAWTADAGPPRLLLRFAAYSGLVLLAAGLAIFWLVQHDITKRAEQRVDQDARLVTERTLSRRLRASDFAGPLSASRRRQLDSLFQDRVLIAGVLRASLAGKGGTVTYSTDHGAIGERRPADLIEGAIAGRTERQVTWLDIGPRGERTKVLRSYVPVRRSGSAEPIGVVSLSQDYRSVKLQTAYAGSRLAVILGLALVALFLSLLPILRRVTRQLEARNRGLHEQARSLRESRRHHRLVVESAAEAFIGVDEEGRITDWNRQSEKVFGWPREEALGKRYVDLIVPQRFVEQHLAEFRKRRSGGRGRSRDVLERRVRSRSGTEFLVEARISAIKIGDSYRFNAFLHDITERKRAETERELLLAAEREARSEAEQARVLLTAQNERLLELDRLKDEFVSLVSHELRTPLTSISGYVELMLGGEAGDISDEQRHFLEIVDRNAERLLHLVGDLLFLAQVDAGKLTIEFVDVSLDRLVQQCVEAARPLAAEKGIDLASEIVPVPELRGDRERLGQLLDNLVSNAIKFTPSGGTVQIRLAPGKRQVVLEIEDTGIGIPLDEQGQLFERFFRSSTAAEHAIQGTGLGLTIAQAIAERHGGAIEITSSTGQGTTVRVTFPSLAPDERQSAPEEVAA